MAPAPQTTAAKYRRALLTICIMAATIMQAIDTTIANVALPYMQGSLATTQDQINWVLTSYIVSAAIMTAPLGWISVRFGRKKLFILCAAGFTVASMLCGSALSIEQMVLYRILQGVFGAALVPLSQAVLLDIYPIEMRGQAMAIWGMGVMLGPIMGPTLGGWLTDVYSWRWVFFVNLPFGVITVLGLSAFMDESPTRRDVPFDWFGFLAFSLGIGALQMMLDRGEQASWFESNEIWIYASLAIAGLYFFLAHSLTVSRPFFQLEIFKDRNFTVSVVFIFIVGVILLATLALITPFIQDVMGYPVFDAGILLGARGIGTLAAMMVVGRLLRTIDARILVFFGLVLSSWSLYSMIGFSPDTSAQTIVETSVAQGVGLGLIFVPLNTVAFATLAAHLRTDGTAVWTLIRNLGSSIGISIVIAQLTEKTAVFRSQLAEHITPFNDALNDPNVAAILDPSTDTGRSLIDAMLTRQGLTMAYANDFTLMMIVSLAAFPLLLLIRGPKKREQNAASPSDAGSAKELIAVHD
jgi:MFS transporter, DHA2 family, multidrug resistance protein